MPKTIAVLPDDTIDQIAAGEVVENPASVVKELVENAIDAGAELIEVEIVGGGLKKIAVSDDGKGMSREDAELCIQRHATSKIRLASDLLHLASMGFRGEALAAISSISRFSLLTAEKGATGTKVEVEGSEVKKIAPAPRKVGTTVTVKDLFYNVPARKKFQKSSAALSAEIFRMMTMLSLGHPDVGFRLVSGGKETLTLYANEGIDLRAKEVLGKEFLEKSTKIQGALGKMSFKGFIGAPHSSRVNRSGQYLFVNERGVECKTIERAVREGLGTRLDEKRHPQFLLYCTIPGDLVDANVHPQKSQIRLRDEKIVFDKVKELVSGVVETVPQPVFSDHPEPYAAPVFLKEEPIFEVEEKQEQELSLPTSVIGLYGHYLLTAEENALVFVDLKAARFRVIFEEMTREDTAAARQGLLLPKTLEFSPVETAMLLSHLPSIDKIGFTLEPLGGHLFILKGVPPFLSEEKAEEVLREIASALPETIGMSRFEKEREKKLALIAARHGKEKTSFSLEEAKVLFAKVSHFTDDPKGEPIQIRMPKDAIEKCFKTHAAAAQDPSVFFTS